MSTLSHVCAYSEDGQITLPEVGIAIEKLMGNAYRSTYTTREFKNHYDNVKWKLPTLVRDSFQLRPTHSYKASYSDRVFILMYLGVLHPNSEGEEEAET